MKRIFRIEVPASRLEPNIINPETIIMGDIDTWFEEALAKKRIFKRTSKGINSYYYSQAKWKIETEEITDPDEYTFLKNKMESILNNKHSVIAKKYASKPYIEITISTKRIENALKRQVSWK